MAAAVIHGLREARRRATVAGMPQSGLAAIGIDAGGTRTRAVLVSTEGNVLGLGVGGAGNLRMVGEDGLRQALETAVAEAWVTAGLEPRPVEAAFLGVAGVRTLDDREEVRQVVRALRLAREDRILVDHDLRIALAGGLSGAPGLVVVAGTGSACYGRDRQGRQAKAGGWGWLIDDPGSATWLGLRALGAAAKASDGRTPITPLTHALLKALKLEDIGALTKMIYDPEFRRQEFAALAPVVTACAAKGEHVSLGIVEEGCRGLAEMVLAVHQKLDWPEGPVQATVMGGVSQSGGVFFQILSRAVKELVPNVQLTAPYLPPVFGAALLALEALGVELPHRPLAEKLWSEAAAKGLI